MTPEQFAEAIRRQRAATLGEKVLPMSPAMNNSGAPDPQLLAQLEAQASYDPSAKEAQYAEMLRGGQDAMFNTPLPQGRMMGDIYAAPTWSESLNAGVARAIGGYQMGQARRGQEEVDQRKEEANTAGGVLKEALRARELAQQNLENDFKSQEQRIREEENLARQAERTEARKYREAMDAERRSERRTNREFSILDEAGEDITSGAERARERADKRLDRGYKELQKAQTEGGTVPDSVSKRRLKQEESVFQQIENIYPRMQSLLDSGQKAGSGITDFLVEKAANLPVIGGETLANTVNKMPGVGYTQEEQNVRADIDRAAEQYRRAFTGANLTAVEIGLGKDWDPSAKGLSTAQKWSRLQALQNVMNENRASWGIDPLETEFAETEPKVRQVGRSAVGRASSLKTKPLEEMTDEELESYLNE